MVINAEEKIGAEGVEKNGTPQDNRDTKREMVQIPQINTIREEGGGVSVELHHPPHSHPHLPLF